MRTFKENYSQNIKDKKGKEELSKNLTTTYNVKLLFIIYIYTYIYLYIHIYTY
jgi:hypothetical protein